MHRSFLILALLLTASVCTAEPQAVHITTLRAQMRYDVTDFTVRPGDEVKIVLDNVDDMPHNLLIHQPGTDVLDLAARLMDKPEEAFKNGYVPDDPRLVARSKLVQPKARDEFTFKVPEKVGVYPFVCTFPGHAALMNGRMRVSLVTPGLTDLKFALYQGKWEKLPDFSGLTPHREGDIPDGLVQIELDDYKNHFGIVYTGKLNVPKDGDYTFSIAGDDGLRLLIDGKTVVENEGPQAAKTRTATTKLTAGVRDVRVEYFQTEGELGIYLAWKGAEFANTALSKRLHADTKSSDTTGMPLMVGSEPEIYRNFIAKAGARPIGVGYPGGFNLAWDAAQMNLVLLWRGGFIDTALHWKHRGGGEQPPMGTDQVRPGGDSTVPFAVLDSAEAAWPVPDKKALKAPAAGYDWKGYTLDARRFPTFSYAWQEVNVTDRFDTVGAAESGGKFIRTLVMDGAIPANAFMRVAAGNLRPDRDGFLVDNALHVAVSGAKLVGSNLLVPARAETKISYSWPVPNAVPAQK